MVYASTTRHGSTFCAKPNYGCLFTSRVIVSGLVRDSLILISQTYFIQKHLKTIREGVLELCHTVVERWLLFSPNISSPAYSVKVPKEQILWGREKLLLWMGRRAVVKGTDAEKEEAVEEVPYSIPEMCARVFSSPNPILFLFLHLSPKCIPNFSISIKWTKLWVFFLTLLNEEH